MALKKIFCSAKLHMHSPKLKECPKCLAGDTTKEVKQDRSRRTRPVDLDYSYKQLKTVLGREIHALMGKSYKQKLNAKDARCLIDYIKLVKELKLIEEAETPETDTSSTPKNDQ